eukprot:6014749-Alexandrium_andersonii.AAC.1
MRGMREGSLHHGACSKQCRVGGHSIAARRLVRSLRARLAGALGPAAWEGVHMGRPACFNLQYPGGSV